MVITSCLGLSAQRTFALKIFKVKRKKQGQWQHFEVDLKNKRIFCRSSHPDVFFKKGPLKYLARLTGHQF